MAVITIVGSGMMGSGIGIPASDNGHEIRMVGTQLDREIVVHARKTGWHLTMKRQLPASYKFYQIEQLGAALEGADAVVSGVSSFGLDWFLETVLPVVPETLPVLAVTKGMVDTEEGKLLRGPAQENLFMYEKNKNKEKVSD